MKVKGYYYFLGSILMIFSLSTAYYGSLACLLISKDTSSLRLGFNYSLWFDSLMHSSILTAILVSMLSTIFLLTASPFSDDFFRIFIPRFKPEKIGLSYCSEE